MYVIEALPKGGPMLWTTTFTCMVFCDASDVIVVIVITISIVITAYLVISFLLITIMKQ